MENQEAEKEAVGPSGRCKHCKRNHRAWKCHLACLVLGHVTYEQLGMDMRNSILDALLLQMQSIPDNSTEGHIRTMHTLWYFIDCLKGAEKWETILMSMGPQKSHKQELHGVWKSLYGGIQGQVSELIMRNERAERLEESLAKMKEAASQERGLLHGAAVCGPTTEHVTAPAVGKGGRVMPGDLHSKDLPEENPNEFAGAGLPASPIPDDEEALMGRC